MAKQVLLITQEGDVELNIIERILYRNRKAGEIGHVIYASRAIGIPCEASAQEILEHLKKDTKRYSAIFVSDHYADQIHGIKEVIGEDTLIVHYSFNDSFNKHDGIININCNKDSLNKILSIELAKRR